MPQYAGQWIPLANLTHAVTQRRLYLARCYTRGQRSEKQPHTCLVGWVVGVPRQTVWHRSLHQQACCSPSTKSSSEKVNRRT